MSQTFAPARASVLVVDDVAENRDLLVRRSGDFGFNDIDQAVNGIEALAAIAGKAYHLVLLDIMMPELDGFGVLARLKRDGRINDLPVVVISASHGEVQVKGPYRGDIRRSPASVRYPRSEPDCMTRPVSEHDQPHIRSPRTAAAPTSRLRRSGLRKTRPFLKTAF